MTDIVERLRDRLGDLLKWEQDTATPSNGWEAVEAEALAEIERLRAIIESGKK